MDIKKQALLDHLLNQGAIQMADIDRDGNILYSITDKLQNVSPDIYAELKEQYEDHMFKLIKRGPSTMNWRINV
jgi:hypothetical protein